MGGIRSLKQDDKFSLDTKHLGFLGGRENAQRWLKTCPELVGRSVIEVDKPI